MLELLINVFWAVFYVKTSDWVYFYIIQFSSSNAYFYKLKKIKKYQVIYIKILRNKLTFVDFWFPNHEYVYILDLLHLHFKLFLMQLILWWVTINWFRFFLDRACKSRFVLWFLSVFNSNPLSLPGRNSSISIKS